MYVIVSIYSISKFIVYYRMIMNMKILYMSTWININMTVTVVFMEYLKYFCIVLKYICSLLGKVPEHYQEKCEENVSKQNSIKEINTWSKTATCIPRDFKDFMQYRSYIINKQRLPFYFLLFVKSQSFLNLIQRIFNKYIYVSHFPFLLMMLRLGKLWSI